MARSTYIYVVLDATFPGSGIAGTFTVKHELVRWLRRMTDTTGIRVYRCRDGGWFTGEKPPVEMSVEELLK